MGSLTALEREHEFVREAFADVEKLESVADTLSGQSEAALREVATAMIRRIGPVRAAIVADMLQLSQPTVRKWVSAGLLVEAPGHAVMHVDPTRLHRVLHLVRDLRARGLRNKELAEQLWWSLEDRALLEREDLQKSLAQMRGGEVVEL